MKNRDRNVGPAGWCPRSRKHPNCKKPLKCTVDPEDEWLLVAYNWRNRSKDGYVSRILGPYISQTGKYVHLMLHRQIIGAEPGEQVDHINGDPTDNRRCNLRICTHTQNMRNRLGKSGRNLPKGVYRMPSARYRARLRVDRAYIGLGTYDTPEEAALAYNTAATKHFGEFARLNDV